MGEREGTATITKPDEMKNLYFRGRTFRGEVCEGGGGVTLHTQFAVARQLHNNGNTAAGNKRRLHLVCHR